MARRPTRTVRSTAAAAERRVLAAIAAATGSRRRETVTARFLESVLAPGAVALPPLVLLENLTIEGPLRLDLGDDWRGRELCLRGCRLDDRLRVAGGLRRLTLADCEAPSISLRRATVDVLEIDRLASPGHLQLEELQARDLRVRRSNIGGMVALDGAAIGGALVLESSRIGSGKAALQADRVTVGRVLRLGGGEAPLVLDGAVGLTGARVQRLATQGDTRCEAGLDLRRARIESVAIGPGARLGPVLLDRAELGDLEIAAGATLVGPVAGDGVVVAGALSFGGEHSVGQGVAIDLTGARVAGALRLHDSFDGRGLVRLAGCEIGGPTILRGRLTVAGGNGLDLSRVQLARLEIDFGAFEGGVSIRQSTCTGLLLAGAYRCPADLPLHLGLACSGRVSLGAPGRATRVDGALSLIGHSCHELTVRGLTVTAAEEGRWAGVAVAARHLRVETLARIGHAEDGPDGVWLNGLLALDYARLGDDVRFAGVMIVAPPACAIAPPRALSLRKAQIAGDVELGAAGPGDAWGLRIEGEADLSGMAIGGDLMMERLDLTAGASAGRLNLSSIAVGGALRVSALNLKGRWAVDLSDTRVGRLDDDHGLAWSAGDGAEPAMTVATLVYDRIETRGRDGLDDRLAWLARHARGGGGFSPQPYRTLIAALTAVGDVSGVRRAALASLRQQRRLGSGSRLARFGNALLDLTSGYGYLPTRAALTVLVYFLIGWAGTEAAVAQGAFQASPFLDGSVLTAVAQSAPGRCPWMQPPLYALDLMAPMTTLGNENFCSVRPEAEAWHWATILYRLGGWVLLSIALLTFAGILKRDV